MPAVGHCINGAKDYGEIGVDCGIASGCGYCPAGSKAVGEPCDRSQDCATSVRGGCQGGVCTNRDGLAYDGPDAPDCVDVLNKGGTKSGLYQIRTTHGTSLEWCEQERGGGGWLLVLKVGKDAGSRYHYDGAGWPSSDCTGNECAVPTNNAELEDDARMYKSRYWSRKPFTRIGFALYSYTGFYEASISGTHQKVWDIMSGGTNKYQQPREWYWRLLGKSVGQDKPSCVDWQPNW